VLRNNTNSAYRGHTASMITIAIPTFKRPELLIQSLNSAISQTCSTNYTILIVDDDPDSFVINEINDFLRNPRRNVDISYHKNASNLGIYGNWNRCLELCSTPYITILNDDDLLDDTFIAEVSSLITNYDLVAVDARFIDSPEKSRSGFVLALRAIWRKLLTLKNAILPHQIVKASAISKSHPPVASLGVVFSKNNALEIGGFFPDMYPSADYDFFVRYWKHFRCLKLRKVLATYRWGFNVSLKTETLEGWIEKDTAIKRDLFNYFLPNPLSKIGNFLINLKCGISAENYHLVNPNFNGPLVLNRNKIPLYRFAKYDVVDLLCSLAWRIIVSDFVIRKIGRRKK